MQLDEFCGTLYVVQHPSRSFLGLLGHRFGDQDKGHNPGQHKHQRLEGIGPGRATYPPEKDIDQDYPTINRPRQFR